MMAGSMAFAASPYVGTSPEEAFEKGGKYYLYQVESGKWLQSNRHENGNSDWTTHAELGGIGFDIELRRPNENFTKGYQIFCHYTNNGELNGTDEDRFFLDQGDRMLTEWIFEKDGEGYKIKVEARDPEARDRDKIAEDKYIGYNDANNYGGLSDDPLDFTWQLVSVEERIEKMKAEAKAKGSADATFLLPWNEHDRNNLRDRQWTVVDKNDFGGGVAVNGTRFAPVVERWNRVSHRASITLEGLPTGTYSFAIQGYYRDGSIEDEGTRQRGLAGTSEHLASYFIGAENATVMSIIEGGKDEWAPGFEYEAILPDADGIAQKTVWVPNSMDNAGYAFTNDVADVDVMSLSTPYMNDWITAGVPDGTLTVGVEKTDTDHERDWFVYKRMFLRYDGEQVKGEDLTGLQAQLQALIDEAKTLYQSEAVKAAITDAEDVLANALSSSALLQTIDSLQALINTMKDSQGVINTYLATLKFYQDAEAQELFDAAANRGDYDKALRTLRYARRRAAREIAPDVYTGVTADELKNGGDFYLYNVGQQQFFSGGSDWGAHAALANPGVLLTFEPEEGVEMSFNINTHLENGTANDRPKSYLNYRGYCDCAYGDDFLFIPVEGRPGVYNIVQNDYPDVYMAWNPNANVDGNGADETTVGTENRGLDPADENAMWKVITLAEREAQIEKASIENPVDLSFYISNPGFNQRATDEFWVSTGNRATDDASGRIWDRGNNRNDFAWEYWNYETFELNQGVEADLPEGIYRAEVQGIYRNGSHDMQATNIDDTDNNNLAYFYANVAETALPNILEGDGLCPGEGAAAYDITYEEDPETGEPVEVSREEKAYYGKYVNELENWFHCGYYKTSLVFEHNGGEIFLGIYKEYQATLEDWAVVDNFRIVYYGKDTTVEEVENLGQDSIKEIATEAANGKVYNLQGIEVVNPTVRGIYIQNGKKFMIK